MSKKTGLAQHQNGLFRHAKKRYVWSIKNVKRENLIVFKISSCQYETNYEKMIFHFPSRPLYAVYWDDIFPDSPLFRVRLLWKLARSLSSLARE